MSTSTSIDTAVTVGSLVDGRPLDSSSTDEYEVIDPATAQPLTRYRVASAGDVDAAVVSARAAQRAWARRTAGERAALLLQLADVVEQHRDEFVRREVLDVGKPVAAFRDDEFVGVLDSMRYLAGAGRSLEAPASGEYIPGRTSILRREPVGVVAAITPWNFPLLQAVIKIVPALAVGNTVVVKPAEDTPLSTAYFVELAATVLPPGTVNLVLGPAEPTGQALAEHPEVDLISFTGSVAGGRAVAAAAAAGVKRVVLELGGNAPALVFDDADLDRATEILVACAYGNAGQDCTASSRLLVHEQVADELTRRVVEAVGALRVGDPWDESTDVGPLISARQRDSVSTLLAEGSASGRVLIGGERPDRAGYFLDPTVVVDVTQSDRLVADEIFGPVITIQRFTDEAEALALANGTPYGLAASVWTNDLARAHRLSASLDFGAVWINDHTLYTPDLPQGGFGASGYGKENGVAGLEDLTRVKHVSVYVGDD